MNILRARWLLLAALSFGCSAPAPENRVEGAGGGAPDEDLFVEVARQAGIDFVHSHGGSGERYMVETVGSGCG